MPKPRKTTATKRTRCGSCAKRAKVTIEFKNLKVTTMPKYASVAALIETIAALDARSRRLLLQHVKRLNDPSLRKAKRRDVAAYILAVMWPSVKTTWTHQFGTPLGRSGK